MKEVFTVSAVDEKEVAAELPGSKFSVAEKIAGRLVRIGIIASSLNGRTVDIQARKGEIENTRDSLKRIGLMINGCDPDNEAEAV